MWFWLKIIECEKWKYIGNSVIVRPFFASLTFVKPKSIQAAHPNLITVFRFLLAFFNSFFRCRVKIKWKWIEMTVRFCVLLRGKFLNLKQFYFTFWKLHDLLNENFGVEFESLVVKFLKSWNEFIVEMSFYSWFLISICEISWNMQNV